MGGRASGSSKGYSQESMDYAKNKFKRIKTHMGWESSYVTKTVKEEIEEELKWAKRDYDTEKHFLNRAKKELDYHSKSLKEHPNFVIGYEYVQGFGNKPVYDTWHLSAKDGYNRYSRAVASSSNKVNELKTKVDFLSGALNAMKSTEYKNSTKKMSDAWEIIRQK